MPDPEPKSKYKVKQGDTLISIAALHEFVDWEFIWNHPENGELRQKRESPMVLFAGDEVFIPEKEPRWEAVALNRKHVFQLKPLRTRLQLILEDELGGTYEGADFVLDAEVWKLKGQVGPRGLVTLDVPPDLREATLIVNTEAQKVSWVLQIGDLDPIEEVSGCQARLNNLGFDTGESLTGVLDAKTKAALEAFQVQHRLKVTGEFDEATKIALRERALV